MERKAQRLGFGEMAGVTLQPHAQPFHPTLCLSFRPADCKTYRQLLRAMVAESRGEVEQLGITRPSPSFHRLRLAQPQI